VDTLLSGVVGSILPTDEVIALRASQASWHRSMGDIDGAAARYQAIWDAYRERDDYGVFVAGITLARWRPVPTHCDERLALARAVLQKIQTARTLGTKSRLAPSERVLLDLEYDCQVVIADSGACPGEGPAAQRALARARVLRPE
jgi:hypothetical protein